MLHGRRPGMIKKKLYEIFIFLERVVVYFKCGIRSYKINYYKYYFYTGYMNLL